MLIKKIVIVRDEIIIKGFCLILLDKMFDREYESNFLILIVEMI